MLRSFTRFCLLALVCVGLSGCFQPLYGPSLSPAPMMASIEVMPMEGHLGYEIKSELDFLLNNGTPPKSPVFRMTVAPKGRIGAVIVDVATARPQIMTYIVDANYSLVEIKTGRIVTSGSAQITASFDRNTQRFATVRALKDAEERAGKMIAEQLRARIIPVLVTIPG